MSMFQCMHEQNHAYTNKKGIHKYVTYIELSNPDLFISLRRDILFNQGWIKHSINKWENIALLYKYGNENRED